MEKDEISTYDIVLISITMYSAVMIYFQYILKYPEEVIEQYKFFEYIFSGYFIYDWIYRLNRAENKKPFVVKNIIDLIVSVSLNLWILTRIVEIIPKFKIRYDKESIGFTLLTVIMMFLPVLVISIIGNINLLVGIIYYFYIKILYNSYINYYG